MTNTQLIDILMRVYTDPFASEHDPRSLLRMAATALAESASRCRELEDAAAELKAQNASLRARTTELETLVDARSAH